MYVKVDGFDSSSISLNYGVPQGSVLGPLLFTLYVSPIEDIIKYHGLDAMFYADDTQIYIALNAKYRSADLQRLEKCAADIKSWSVENFLILNDSKTEILHFFPISHVIFLVHLRSKLAIQRYFHKVK